MALEFLKKFDFKKSKELIGIDIGATSIKVCVLKNSKDGFTIDCMIRNHIVKACSVTATLSIIASSQMN